MSLKSKVNDISPLIQIDPRANMESECQSNKRGDSDMKTCILPFQFELDIKDQGRIVSRGYTCVLNLVSQCQKQKKVNSRPGIFAERRMDRQTE